jgi:pimeloyl-ACP methyl ester carboxylesterase
MPIKHSKHVTWLSANKLCHLFLIALSLTFSGSAHALSCGTSTGNLLPCDGPQTQFAGGFTTLSGYGGFGGGNCSASKTPVIYIPGNGDHAINFDAKPALAPSGYSIPAKSVYGQLKAAGYNNCELFGITYLSANQRQNPAYNHHEHDKQVIIADFIDQIIAYTGASKVDIVSHSMGVSMGLSALNRFGKWGQVRRLVNIGGAIRGLNACYAAGYANAYLPTCASQNYWDSYTFGFYPGGYYWSNNDWTGASGQRSMRKAPYYNPGTKFYSITAGQRDQVLCSTSINYSSCDEGALFGNYSNVKAQLDVGAGTSALAIDYDFSDGAITNLAGGDLDGVGHFGSRINAGKIIVNMLTTNCTGIACANGYSGPVQ